jgi:hypothetical protein
MQHEQPLDVEQVIKDHPWVLEKKQMCILSPDSDGFLCGLLMAHYLDWKVVGFYDGKALVIQKGVSPSSCVFLDMEIYRPNVRSIGQHMVMFNKKHLPENWSNFDACISANNLRNYDYKNSFKTKYPFGTIHLLLAILGARIPIPIHKHGIGPLLYTDGTFKNQFNYPENCLSWLAFMEADASHSPLGRIFMDPHFSTYELMVELQSFFSDIAKIGKQGDKLKLTDTKGGLLPLTKESSLPQDAKEKMEQFLTMLGQRTGWMYTTTSWCFGPYTTHTFKKGSIQPGKARYLDLMKKNPLSLAIISALSIEYTLDENNVV